jgi:GNAT superfamily N-acetyltransferase
MTRKAVQTIDARAEHRDLCACCLCDWATDFRLGAERRARWIERFSERGLRIKLALNEAGTVAGMIQYLPIEESTVEGEGLYFVPCVWVHGHKKGRGDQRGRGLGTALLEAAEADARALGAKGMAAWGIWLPVWMKASWWRKHGYRKVDRRGLMVLLWKPFAADAKPPRWLGHPKPVPPGEPGKVTVTVFSNGWCLAGNQTCEDARRAAADLGERVVFREVDTSEHAVLAEWGRSGEVFIDDKAVSKGPPVGYRKLRKLIEKRLKRLPRADARPR